MPSKVGEKERGMERNLGATIQRRLQAEGEKKKKKERQKASCKHRGKQANAFLSFKSQGAPLLLVYSASYSSIHFPALA